MKLEVVTKRLEIQFGSYIEGYNDAYVIAVKNFLFDGIFM